MSITTEARSPASVARLPRPCLEPNWAAALRQERPRERRSNGLKMRAVFTRHPAAWYPAGQWPGATIARSPG